MLEKRVILLTLSLLKSQNLIEALLINLIWDFCQSLLYEWIDVIFSHAFGYCVFCI